jgi:hypothetical protein
LRQSAVAAVAFLLHIGVVSVSLAQQSLAQEPMAGTLDFCSRPVKPSCVEEDSTYTKPAARKACDGDVTRYIAATFNFRNCMAVQMENVIRDTNRLSERFKCKSEGKGDCG